MPNIVVTSTTNSIKVDFGDYASAIGVDKANYRKDKIIKFSLNKSAEFVQAHVQGEINWNLVFASSGQNMIIDTVDTVAPTSNSDLYDKLIALIA